MAKTRACSTQAEVLLDTVIAAQRSAIEHANGVQAFAPEVYTRSTGKGHYHRCTAIGAPKCQIQRGERVTVRQCITHARARITGDAAVACERRHRPDIACRGGMVGKAI